MSVENKIDKDKYLYNLKQYLSFQAVEIKNNNQIRCPNNIVHNNNDNDFSAVIYEDQTHPRVKCFSCGFDGDIYDIAGHYNNTKEFIEQYKIIDGIFGNGDFQADNKTTAPAIKNKKEKEEIIFNPITKDEAKEIYSDSNIDRVRDFSKDEIVKTGKIIAKWIYDNQENNIIAVDVRFEKEIENVNKKQVITFWYNGKSLKMKGSFSLIYNLYESLNTEKPILIHEGAKCAKIGRDNLKSFCNISWSRGVENVSKADFTAYKNKQVYILPDNDIPGLKAAGKIKEQLQNAIILKDIYNNFNLTENKKADIEQILEKASETEIEEYIFNYKNDYQETKKENIENETGIENNNGIYKPVCLGIADDGMLYFIDRYEKLYNTRRDNITKQKLLNIASKEYWTIYYGNEKGNIDWDNAVDDILNNNTKKEFDSTKIRGRGAWKENGGFVYNDGRDLFGCEIKGNNTYLKKNKKDIGINDLPADKSIMTELKKICMQISFANESDIVRVLGWSFISPFCGALSWRPAILLTGESGSGKSTVLEKIVLPISNAKHYTAHYSSPAGIRADVGNDSCAICLEEAEGGGNNNNSQKEFHRNELFGLMRTSSSDDAPDGVKSNKDQQVVKYSMKNMFLFVSITPTISDVADDNRIFKVNFVKPEKKSGIEKWEEIEKSIINLLNEKNTRSIRALAWKLLPKIIDDSKDIRNIMKYQFNKTSRTADGESILVSSFLNMMQRIEITKESIFEFLKIYYARVEKEEDRDEVEEMLNLINDELIEIEIDRVRKKYAIKELIKFILLKEFEDFGLSKSEEMEKEIRRRLMQIGIKVLRNNHIAIDNNHKEIKRIIHKENGYNKYFKRHKYFIEEKQVDFNGYTKRSVIIDIFKDNIIQETAPELPEMKVNEEVEFE